MQLRKPWFGKNNELHGVMIGEELEIAYRARRGVRRVRIIPTPTGVKIISVLPDGLMAEMLLEKLSEQ